MRVPLGLMIGMVVALVLGAGVVAFATTRNDGVQAVMPVLTPADRLDALNSNVQTLVDQLVERDAELWSMRMEMDDWKQLVERAEQHDEPSIDDIKAEKRKRKWEAIASWGAVYDRPEPTEADSAEIDRVSATMYHFLKKAPKRKLAKDEGARWEFAQDIYNAAGEANIPHILWTYQVFKESSYRVNAEGDVGEAGLSQVHGKAAKGCDLQTRFGQLRCGAEWLSRCFDKCGTWEGALTAYASGYCSTNSEDTQDAVLNRILKWMELEAAY